MLKYMLIWTSLVAQTVKNLPAMQKASVQSLGLEDPLEKGMATHPCPCLDNSMDREAWRASVHGVTKSRKQTETKHTYKHVME